MADLGTAPATADDALAAAPGRVPAPAAVLRQLRALLLDVPGPVVAGGVLVGGLLLVASYHHAAIQTGPTDRLTFLLYWAGFLTGALALAASLTAPRTRPGSRLFALIALGLFGMLPRLLRSPGGPLGADEYAHLRQMLETYQHGDVGHVSYLLPITQFFPGLHQVVSALAHLTGIPLWTTALGVITAAHLLSTLGISALVRCAGGSAPAGGLAAVVYLLNPSWVLFDSQVAYESLALPLLIWTLAGAVAACRASGGTAVRLVAAAAIPALTVPLVHHLTAVVMCLLLAALPVAAALGRLATRWHPDGPVRGGPVERVGPLLAVMVCGVGATIWWFMGAADLILHYLSPALVRGWDQLRQILSGSAPAAGVGAATGRRTPFSGTQLPLYEVVSGLVFPLLMFGVVVVAAGILWRGRRRLGPTVWVFGGLALAYFVSIPAVLTAGSSEGAHRSWAFSFIGVAMVCGLAYGLALDGVHPAVAHPDVVHPASRAWPGRVALPPRLRELLHRRRVRLGLVAALLGVLLVGSTANSAENVSSRFPGVPRVGDDERAIDPEGEAVSAWMSTHAAPDTPVLADRFVSLELGSQGRMSTLSPSPTFPVWDLFVQARPISPQVLQQVYGAGIRYVVVDSRMATTRPALGFWFTVDEPGAGGSHPYPASAIARFACLPWLDARYAAGPVTVYEVDRADLLRTMAGSCPGQVTS